MSCPHAAAAFDSLTGEARALPVSDDTHRATPPLSPDSLIWRFYGDIRVQMLCFQRLASTENAIAQLAQAVDDHSVIFGDFLGRARRTAIPVLHTVYSRDPHAWGRRVRDFHIPIKGTMPDGTRYHSLNPELFYWAHATFVDQIIYGTDTFIRRLSYEEKQQIFEEGKTWYRLYGVSARNQPETYDEFVEYFDEMLTRTAPNRVVRYGAGYIRKGVPGPSVIPTWLWRVLSAPFNAFTRTVLAGTLPAEVKSAVGIEWNDVRERRFQRFARTVRALDPVFSRLPIRLAYLPWAATEIKRAAIDPRTPRAQVR